MQTNQVKQYRAHLKLPTIEVTLEANDLGIAKENLNRLMGGNLRFEPAATSGGSTLVYHAQIEGGQTPIGWLALLEIPEAMSIRGQTEARQKQAA